MLQNYLKTALRSLMRQKLYACINIAGLALGLTCSVLILLWVEDELSVDRYHVLDQRIYQVIEEQTYSNGQTFLTPSLPGLLVPALIDEYPEVENATRVTWGETVQMSNEGEYFALNLVQVDAAFFSIFTVDFVEGSAETAFTNLESIVISDETAGRIFGDSPALGRQLLYTDGTPATVSGVIRSRNQESSLKYDALQPYDHWVKSNAWANSGWGTYAIRSFVLLREGADWKAFGHKIKDFIKSKQDGSAADLFLLPNSDRYLRVNFAKGERDTGRIEYVRIFSVIAVFTLVIACINFMNLATARSARRSKEIGIRKVVGADRRRLVGQFMSESLVVSFFAMALALLLAELALPHFNQFTGKGIHIDYASFRTWGILVGISVLAGLFAGFYPAVYMSSFDAMRILKGAFRSGKSATAMRHGLVVFQFVLSLVFMVSTFVIYRQMDFMLHKNLGFDKENVIYFRNSPEAAAQFDAFKAALLNTPAVSEVGRSSQNPVNVRTTRSDVQWEGMQPDEEILFQVMQVDYGLLETMKIPIAEGRAFDASFRADSAGILLNQTAARKMGMNEAVGQIVRLGGRESRVIGVMTDFHANSLRGGIEPMIVTLVPENAGLTFIRLLPGDTQETLEHVSAAYKTFAGHAPAISFVDEAYNALYRSEATVSTLSRWFAGFALFISCLGLFGLATFSAEQRAKEIGVRKVLGASVRQLVAMMTGSFSRLVALAFVIAAPVAWYVMGRWLEGFAYRIELDVWTFALVGLATLAVAWLTVFWQCLRAALVNPVEVLKYE